MYGWYQVTTIARRTAGSPVAEVQPPTTGGETLDALANGHPANRLAELMPWIAGA